MLSCYCSDREPAVLIGKPAAGTRATVVWGRTRAAHQREAIWAILPPAIAMGVKPPDANMRGVNLKTSKRDPSAATTGKQGGVCSVNDAPSERAERLRAANVCATRRLDNAALRARPMISFSRSPHALHQFQLQSCARDAPQEIG